MYIRWKIVGLAVSAVALLATLPRADDAWARQETSAVKARSESFTPAARADTLRHVVRAGEILIFALPDSLGGTAVAGYSLRRAPALSWLVGRSFMWRTLLNDKGDHDVILTAELRDGWLETLIVAIEVE